MNFISQVKNQVQISATIKATIIVIISSFRSKEPINNLIITMSAKNDMIGKIGIQLNLSCNFNWFS